MKWFKYLDAPYLFILLALVFGALFIKELPPLWGLDEITHFNRAYQISTGNFFEDKLPGSKAYGGQMPANIVDLSGYTYKDLIDSQNVDSQAKTHSFTDSQPSTTLKAYDFTGSAIYPPFVYTAPAAAIWLARSFHASLGTIIQAGRLATLFLYTSMISLALFLVRDNKAKWLIFLIALLPMSVSQAATISADSVVIGLGLLLFALLSRTWTNRQPLSWPALTAIVLIGSILTIIKPVYLLLAIVAALLPGGLLPTKRTSLARAGIIVLLTLPMLIWVYLVHHMVEVGAAIQLGSTVSHKVAPASQMLFVIEHPLSFIHHLVSNAIHQDWYGETFGLLGWNYVKIPSLIRGLLFGSLVLVTFWRLPISDKNRITAWLYVASALLTMLGFIMFFYLIYNSVGSPLISGVQGRYFIPALPFLFYGLGKLVKSIKVDMSPLTAQVLFPIISLVSLATSIALYSSITYK